MNRDQLRRRNDERYKEHSKKRLMQNLRRKFNTTMIGALAQFEESFGELWGHGLALDELSKDQMYYRKKWEEVRTNILNNGNNQARAADDEIAQYTLTWNKYRTEFIVLPQAPPGPVGDK